MPPQGEGSGGIFSAIGSFLGSLLGFTSDSNANASNIAQSLQNQITSLQTNFLGLGSLLKSLAETVFKALRHILDDIIHLRFLHLLQDYEALKEKIKAWARRHPLLLRILRSILHPTQTALLTNVLNMIQRLRQLLLIFRIFHLRFAVALDNFLGRLEARVIRNTLSIVRKVNEISTLLSLVLDPFQVIRRNPIFGVFTRALDSWFKLLTGHGMLARVNATHRLGKVPASGVPFSVVREQMFAATRGEPGPYTDVQEIGPRVFDVLDQDFLGTPGS